MDKNKRDLMILIAIIFIGINYATYTYFISRKMESVQAFKNNYITKEEKLSEMEVKKALINQRKKEIEELKKKTSSFSNNVPSKIDTPGLIYDFYVACQKYKVTGDSISFQLLDNSDASKNANSEDEGNNNVYTLTISLKVTGHKIDMETFIKSLDNITQRRLNVKSITLTTINLEGKDDTKVKTDAKADKKDTENVLSKASFNEVKPYTLKLLGNKLYADGLVKEDNKTDNLNENKDIIPNIEDNSSFPNQISAEIVFYQYIEKTKENQAIMDKNYKFYDSKKEGFKNISDMFK